MRRQGMARVLRPGFYGRLALGVGISGMFLAILAERLKGLDPGLLLHAMGEVGVLPWLGAILATMASFWAVVGYDRALHCHLASGIAPGRAGLAGFAAISIGQTVGLGVISGALVRWRVLPELGLAGALRLSLLVAVSFLLAWSAICAVTLILFPVATVPVIAPIVLAGLVLSEAACLYRPRPWMPNLITQGRLLVLAAVDCLAAGLALWLLVPGDLGLAVFLPVFLLALGAGLVSGAPAGLGAFEIVLMALLPGVGQAELLAGIIAWRTVYYAIPAVAGAGIAFLVRGVPGAARSIVALPLPEIAEAGLAAQGEFAPHPDGLLAGRTFHGLVALSDVTDLARFRAAAKMEGRWPVLYKASARVAARARAAGMVVLPVAREGWLCPQSFRLDVPARASLRRKLRKAAASGVTVVFEPRPDWADLARVNVAWSLRRGGENGFSMGRFDPAYLSRQRVMVARQSGRVVGFASFHTACIAAAEVWTLDLLRPDPDAPDGTSQALIVAALEMARRAGVRRLSLAAVPIGSDPAARGIVAWMGQRFAPGAMDGLSQFKEGFAPTWQRLYLAGPSLAALAIVGGEILGRVRRPMPLANMSPTSTLHEDYEIAYDRNPWQREGTKLA